ncbi:PREDICTED: uncharacterized protein LOC105960727 [Erythranthe guttata]|uniref:uncharacterized protein LOC105960727 n=1 Tax=Erythranthe guttata TaxID=4155 RepID=UPI00064DAFAE|nr:PREDICTED: uncharacterized protein LOC105960727 [Erythranthe guttata]|eukprot:XP_012840389.1 PREDICTED: uncharacterized protein LOC105960727 [Erythranthe guttata]
MDVLHEENENFFNTSYSGKSIYEWNIDGGSDKHIITQCHRMLMYGSACRISGNNDLQTAQAITVGFTGQLKDGETKPNAVYSLVLTILEHFTGRFTNKSENTKTLLLNMKCKTLSDFRWYKDTFLSRIFDIPECNQDIWKNKFVDGLPYLFAERIKKVLRKDSDHIAYEAFTFGQIVSTCIQEGLSLCNEIKLRNQIRKDNLLERKLLGHFCDQFGLDNPGKKDFHKNKREFNHKPNYRKRRRHYDDNKQINHSRDKQDNDKGRNRYHKKRSYKKDSNFLSKIVCRKCGRTGHYANQCYAKDKIKNLDIDDNLKETLYKIVMNSEDDTDSNRSDSSQESDFSDDISTKSNECNNCALGPPCLKSSLKKLVSSEVLESS